MSHINVAYESTITNMPGGPAQRAAASRQALNTIALKSGAAPKAASAIKSDSVTFGTRPTQRLTYSGPQAASNSRSTAKPS